MNIRGITVSVNYSDLLAVGLDRWHQGLNDLLVVTSTSDQATQDLCRKAGIDCHVTDVFFANGAKFNKGAALSEAIIAKNWRKDADWMLVFDADMVPPTNWRDVVEAAKPQVGKLYGAPRFALPEKTPLAECLPTKGSSMPLSWVIGFFSLFNSKDPRVPKDPMFETHWTHAGNFDTTFSWLWGGQNIQERRQLQEMIPLPLVHLGQQRQHWLGRGKGQELHDLLGQRQHFHDVAREKVPAPPMPQPKSV